MNLFICTKLFYDNNNNNIKVLQFNLYYCFPSTNLNRLDRKCLKTVLQHYLLPGEFLTWNRRSRPCLALPPAESPSTMNISIGADNQYFIWNRHHLTEFLKQSFPISTQGRLYLNIEIQMHVAKLQVDVHGHISWKEGRKKWLFKCPRFFEEQHQL